MIDRPKPCHINVTTQKKKTLCTYCVVELVCRRTFFDSIADAGVAALYRTCDTALCLPCSYLETLPDAPARIQN